MMDTDARAVPARWPLMGVLSFALALLVAIGAVMVWVTSTIEGFNPPDWIRIATMAPAPFLAILSAAFGFLGLKGRGRTLAIAGLVIIAMSLASFVYLLVSNPY
ncbi:MAG: hypothetical protein ACYC6C_01740 [Coriobacteriia bacterium]